MNWSVTAFHCHLSKIISQYHLYFWLDDSEKLNSTGNFQLLTLSRKWRIITYLIKLQYLMLKLTSSSFLLIFQPWVYHGAVPSYSQCKWFTSVTLTPGEFFIQCCQGRKELWVRKPKIGRSTQKVFIIDPLACDFRAAQTGRQNKTYTFWELKSTVLSSRLSCLPGMLPGSTILLLNTKERSKVGKGQCSWLSDLWGLRFQFQSVWVSCPLTQVFRGSICE